MVRRSGIKDKSERLSTLRNRIRQWDVAALLITHSADIRYLTGFIGDDSWLLVPARGQRATVISDFRYQEQIKREAPQVTAIMRGSSLEDELAKIADRRRYKKVAVQADYVSLATRKRIGQKIGSRRLVHVEDGMLGQRAVKDSEEVKSIRRAVAITQKAFLSTIKQLRSGQREFEVAALLEYEMRRIGADGRAFATIIAADANASLPHAVPGNTKIKNGGIVLFDWGAVVDGYCADLTRVVALGAMKPILRQIYQIVLDAHDAAISQVKPGKRFKDIDRVARDLIASAGYGKQFGHSLGHGIGLQIHEQPVLSERSMGCMQPGHVFTVEPGIYLPGIGGIRIESDVLVTENGHQVLSQLPKDLQSAII